MSQEPQIFILTAHTLLTSDFLTIQKKDSSKILAQLSIPSYQRPYRWGDKQISALINDLREYHETPVNKKPDRYRLGTLILHYEDGRLDVVDGQQRLVTLALINSWKEKEDDLNKVLESLYKDKRQERAKVSPLLSKSQDQAKANREIIKNIISQNEVNRIFKPEQYEFVCIVVNELSEAFQLFDSQNSRGKPLSGTNLLKAYHLRAMDIHGSSGTEKLNIVKQWDTREKNIDDLISNYLYRIRQWSKGRSAKLFTKDDIDCFKGINMAYRQDIAPFEKRINFMQIGYQSLHSLGMERHFPFSADQVIINGKSFFGYVFHYLEKLEDVKSIPDIESANEDKDLTEDIKKFISSPGTGNRYLRWMFLSGLLYFHDKFSRCLNDDIYKRFVRHYFSSCYILRASQKRILINTIDNKSSAKESIFSLINHEHNSMDILTAMAQEGIKYAHLKINDQEDHKYLAKLILSLV